MIMQAATDEITIKIIVNWSRTPDKQVCYTKSHAEVLPPQI